MVRAPQIHTKDPDATQNVAVSFDDMLDSDESLTGTPTVTGSPSGLTIDNVRVNTAVVTVNGASVAIGRAVQFRVAAGTAGVRYELTVTAATDSSPAQTLPVECVLRVESD